MSLVEQKEEDALDHNRQKLRCRETACLYTHTQPLQTGPITPSMSSHYSRSSTSTALRRFDDASVSHSNARLTRLFQDVKNTSSLSSSRHRANSTKAGWEVGQRGEWHGERHSAADWSDGPCLDRSEDASLALDPAACFGAVQACETPICIHQADDKCDSALLPACIIDEGGENELSVLVGWCYGRDGNEDNGERAERGPERGTMKQLTVLLMSVQLVVVLQLFFYCRCQQTPGMSRCLRGQYS